MQIKDAYNIWSKNYDTDNNKTRDLEEQAIREILKDIPFENCLEIGCGTGKNTEWLISKATHVTAVDFSEEMLAKAKSKINSDRVKFVKADITKNWIFTNEKFDLISFSLVLEHIEELDHIFQEAAEKIITGGFIYVGELHPFKQYSGSKASFESEKGLNTLICYNHNISDFIKSAKKYGLQISDINEYFDNNDRGSIPRILTLLFKK